MAKLKLAKPSAKKPAKIKKSPAPKKKPAAKPVTGTKKTSK